MKFMYYIFKLRKYCLQASQFFKKHVFVKCANLSHFNTLPLIVIRMCHSTDFMILLRNTGSFEFYHSKISPSS